MRSNLSDLAGTAPLAKYKGRIWEWTKVAWADLENMRMRLGVSDFIDSSGLVATGKPLVLIANADDQGWEDTSALWGGANTVRLEYVPRPTVILKRLRFVGEQSELDRAINRFLSTKSFFFAMDSIPIFGVVDRWREKLKIGCHISNRVADVGNPHDYLKLGLYLGLLPLNCELGGESQIPVWGYVNDLYPWPFRQFELASSGIGGALCRISCFLVGLPLEGGNGGIGEDGQQRGGVNAVIPPPTVIGTAGGFLVSFIRMTGLKTGKDSVKYVLVLIAGIVILGYSVDSFIHWWLQV